MSSITGIELGPDSCVLARVRTVAAVTEVSALHVVEPSVWPPFDDGVAAALRDVRRRKGFPRRAVAALWALSEPADANAPHVRPLIRPLTSAGFRVDRVVTVPEALAALARTRPRPNGDAVVWLALNTHGAAIAIVRDAARARPDAPSAPELLYSRVIDWRFSSEVAGQRAEMLQRYSLIAHLAPEVRRAITAARNMHGVSVTAAITCGNLPALRSLTMPLIEELDLEVETLDSSEGVVSTGAARTDRFAESAPALRVAVGAAMSTASVASGQRKTVRTILATAAAAALVGGGLWFASRQFNRTTVRPASARIVAENANRVTAPPTRTTPPALAAPPPVAQQKTQQTPPPVAQQNTPVPAAPLKTVPVQQPTAPQPKTTPAPTSPAQKPAAASVPPPQTAKPTVPTQAAVSPPVKPPAQQATQKPTEKPTPPPVVSQPAAQIVPKPTAQTAPTLTPQAAPKPAAQTAPKPQPMPVVPPPAPVFERPRDPEPRVDSVLLPESPPARRPVPMKEPVPSVESILIARDRRVAVVGGTIVSVGDSVGSRVVVQIERDAVVLREPSGYELRIALRGAGVSED